jgi:hypothetical protein
MPRALQPDVAFLCQAACVDASTLARWGEAGIVRRREPGLKALAVTRLDIMAAAVLAEIARHGIGETALQMISARIQDGADIIARHAIASSSIPTILYHGALRLAEEDGRFAEIIKTDGVDPSSRLFSCYADYLDWCRACDTAPDIQEEALLDVLEPDDLALLPFCYDLICEETPAEWSTVWDLMMLDEVPLLYSRRSCDPTPRDIMDGGEAASWISLSITGIDRQIAQRLARAA